MAKTLAVLVLGAALAGCAGPRGSSARLGVPLVRQSGQHTGGLASARMLARYYKAPLTPRVERLMSLASASGDLSASELRASLESSGYTVSVFSGRLDHGAEGLYGYLDRGQPVVVLVGSSYMLVDGYEDGRLRLLDPRSGVVEAAAEDFDRAWSDSQRLALVARR
jgi:ABC-type bacteriocin/lantibiotic exporter with double-glycine peptidase domain